MLLFEKDVLNVKVKTSEIHIDKLKKEKGEKYFAGNVKKKKKSSRRTFRSVSFIQAPLK